MLNLLIAAAAAPPPPPPTPIEVDRAKRLATDKIAKAQAKRERKAAKRRALTAGEAP